MFCVRFFLCWISSDLQNKREFERRRQAEKIELHTNENQTVLTVYDDIDGKRSSTNKKNPLIYRILEFWSYFESLSLTLVLISMKHSGPDYHDNFLHGFCSNEQCQGNAIIIKIIVYKLVTAILLLIGTKTVSFHPIAF